MINPCCKRIVDYLWILIPLCYGFWYQKFYLTKNTMNTLNRITQPYPANPVPYRNSVDITIEGSNITYNG